jgi:type IX secretion system PorP/SprF family membrane protein
LFKLKKTQHMTKKAAIRWMMAIMACIFMMQEEVEAQQDAQYSMYMFNQLPLNPGYAGARERASVMALYRHQWTGIQGAPRTFSISGHAPLLNDRLGLGGWLASDNIGVTNIITISLNYAYRIKFKNESKLAIGMNVTMNNFRQRFSELSVNDVGDPNFGVNNISAWSPNFGYGIFYYGERYYVGVSVPHLLNASINKSFRYEGREKVARQYRHYFATGGVVINAGEQLKIKPSVMFKYVQHAPSSLDGNLGFLIKEQLWLGVSYRFGWGKAGGGYGSDAVIGMIEYDFLKNLRIGYAYDFTLSQLNNYTSGTHEVMLGYEFSKRETYLTPRRMTYF